MSLTNAASVWTAAVYANSLAMMDERGNGEGAGYAAYGIYPEYTDAYALHVFFDNVRENKPALVQELE